MTQWLRGNDRPANKGAIETIDLPKLVSAASAVIPAKAGIQEGCAEMANLFRLLAPGGQK